MRVETNTAALAGAKRCPARLVPSKCGSTQNMAANIKVVVRVRPPNSKELDLNSRVAIEVIDDNMLVFDPKEQDRPFFYQGVQQPSRGFLKRPNKELKFVFDRVCGQEASNKDVFDVTTKEVLVSLMDGYNCSVFVYGATGAGKTFTMIGSKEYPGITYLTMEHLFDMISSFESEREFEIGVSYIEVYNENVFDLLKPSKKPLQLREDSKYGVMVAGLTVHNIKTARELLNMLENGNKNRTQHPTDANAESSRSHAVFQVYVNMRYKTTSQQRVVKLSMIDLAGSERAAATGCVGERFKEGANINRSLLSLGNCINRLSDGSAYIPYRDSKLTRLLKDSLGGNCRTVMIANVSPSSHSYEDTYNTLKYAARANKIQLTIKKNIVDGSVRVSQYVKMNEELTKKVKELEEKLAMASAAPAASTLDEKALQWRARVEAAAERCGELEAAALALMARQRVLALRRRRRAAALRHVADLAHRSSSEGLQQMCTEDLPRHERAAESYAARARRLDESIVAAAAALRVGRERLARLTARAEAEAPALRDLARLVRAAAEARRLRAHNRLQRRLLRLENAEIDALAAYAGAMPRMLRRLYLMLKGYGKVTPSLAAEYLAIAKEAKSGKTIAWSDADADADAEPATDAHYDYILNLDVDNPVPVPELPPPKGPMEGDDESDAGTDGDRSTDAENGDPKVSVGKRKGTPVEVLDTIVVDDSLSEDNLDSTQTIHSSGKKMKMEYTNNVADDVENYDHAIDPKNLNSTFVLAEKLNGIKKEPVKFEPPKRGLVDRTNLGQKTINFNDRAKVVKPVVGKAAAFRRPATAPAPAPAGFGSTRARAGAPLSRAGSAQQTPSGRFAAGSIRRNVGFKAVRTRERLLTHPYSRSRPATAPAPPARG